MSYYRLGYVFLLPTLFLGCSKSDDPFDGPVAAKSAIPKVEPQAEPRPPAGKWTTVPQPDPKELARQRQERRAYYQAEVRDVYDKLCLKSPKWDVNARLMLDAAVRFWSNRQSRYGEQEIAAIYGQKAFEAGCRDPWVLYIYGRMTVGLVEDGLGNAYYRYQDAAPGMEAGSLSKYRRGVGLTRAAATLFLVAQEPDKKTIDKALYRLEMARGLLAEIIARSRPRQRG